MTTWTRGAVEALGPTTNVPTTARIVGVDPETIYTAIRNGTWTATRVLRIGRVIKIPTLDIIRLLYAPEAVSAQPIPSVPAECQHAGDVQVKATESHPQCGCRVAPDGAVLPLRVAT